VFLLALQVTVNPNSSAASDIHDVCIYIMLGKSL